MHVLMGFQESGVMAKFPYLRFLLALPIFTVVCEVARRCAKRRKEFDLAFVHPHLFPARTWGALYFVRAREICSVFTVYAVVNVVVCSVILLCLQLNVQKANYLHSGLRVRFLLDQMGKSSSATVAVKR